MDTKHIENFIRRLTFPLVKWLVKVDCSYPLFSQIIKEVYIEAACELRENDKKTNISKLSLSTGIHRKDVKSILENKSGPGVSKQKIPLKAQIFSAWLSSDFATDVDGEPLAISKTGKDSFETLSKSISKDIAAGTMLSEAIERGYVHKLKDGSVCLNIESLVDSDDNSEQLFFFSENIRDHLAAATSNISGDNEKFFERAVFFNELTENEKLELKTYINQAAQNFLFKINKKVRDDTEGDIGGKNSYRMKVGVYYFDEKEDGNI